jgi:hypothetical protein
MWAVVWSSLLFREGFVKQLCDVHMLGLMWGVTLSDLQLFRYFRETRSPGSNLWERFTGHNGMTVADITYIHGTSILCM